MVVPLVIGIVAAGSGHARGGGYLSRNASLVLTMDPHRGDQSVLGQLEDADVLMVDDTITAVGVNLRKPSGTSVIDGRGMIVMPGFVDTYDHPLQSLMRGCGADDNVVGWLDRCPGGIRRAAATESEISAAVRLSTAGLIATCKSLFEKYQAASRLSIKRVIATYTNVSLVRGNSS
ncbi:MAG TPA: hypothetical protein VI542_02800 [Candidatus Tectomicrobia bacterium]